MGSVVKRTISEDVLDKTMSVFWEHGYFNVSLDDLILATGFNKAAIYKYFGSKHDLFIAMLKRYRENVTPSLIAPLKSSENGLNAIKQFFNQFLKSDQAKLPRGCFLIATASELPTHKGDVSLLITEFMQDLKALFLQCLSSAKKQKTINNNADVEAVSDFLVTNIFGLMTLKRANASLQMIHNHIKTLINYLSFLEKDSGAA